ncbi:hypothetical protein EUGRSUZ_F03488 [Eucalyptus grandis]|uniref:Uncharacterized protein n=2 Tax=Eucalyptus grandis TaxID=71139 RepID=A0ACC3KLF9_EUCGR|nr:hypothetical protein EUGRSUZ_F03488 [Eucalyptus grandis]
MGKESKRPVLGAAWTGCLLIAVSLCIALLVLKDEPFLSWRNQIPNWRGNGDAGELGEVTGERDALKDLLRRLVRGEERNQLQVEGFTCHFDLHTEMCLSAKPVRISNGGLTVHVRSDGSQFRRLIRPYARREDRGAMKLVTQFIATDYNQRWIQKYSSILNRLSDYEAPNLADGSVHCFPGAVVGLTYHGNLALNTSDVPGGHSMREFRQFLRESYNLKTKNVHEIGKLRKPVLILISRSNSRKFLNEDAIMELAQELGFQAVMAGPSTISNLEQFAKMVGSCSVLIGVHGAGLANEIFLPDGAVVVQVVLLGLEWASTNYFEIPATAMDLQYLEYKIEPQESSLAEEYGLDHPVIVDPLSVFAKGYPAVRAVYVDGQNVTINLDRFKGTLVEAKRRVGHSTT